MPEWILFAFIHVVFVSGYNLFNQHAKLDPFLLMLWRGAGPVLLLTPVLFYVPAPKEITFYVYTALIGLMISYLDRGIFEGAQRFGAGPVSRVMPLFVVLTMVAWWIAAPSSFFGLWQTPLKFAGVVFSVILIIVCLFLLKKDAFSFAVLNFCKGMIFVSFLIDIFAKKALENEPNRNAAVLYYVFMTALFAFLPYFFGVLFDSSRRKIIKEKLFCSSSVKAGGGAVLLVIASMFFRNLAIAETPNPAYVSAISATMPFWVMIYNNLIGFPDQADKRAGAGVVAGSILLILCVK